MQNNLRNRSVALASTFALALTGIVATAPAASANAGVDLEPTSGTNTGAFITDDFQMDIDVNAPYQSELLAVKIDNPDQEILEFEIVDLSTDVTQITMRGFSETGDEVNLDAANFTLGFDPDLDDSNDELIATDVSDRITVDFETAGITSLVVSNILVNDDAVATERAFRLDLQLKESTSDNDFFEYGDGDRGDITVQAWVETEATPDYTDVDAASASAAVTVKWYDPRGVSVLPSVERFSDGTDFNDNDPTQVNDKTLAGALTFGQRDLNLDQINLDNWLMSVVLADNTTVTTQRSLTADRLNKAGTLSTADIAGKIYFATEGGDGTDYNDDSFTALSASSTYAFEIVHTSDTTREFRSVAFNPPTNSVNRDLFVFMSDTDNADQDNTAPTTGNARGVVDTDVALRPGVESFTYTARLYDTDSSDRAKVASQSILAKVTANYLATDQTLTVSGSNETLTAAGQVLSVVGLTNSDGDYSVTVTSSDASALTGYDIEFFSLDSSGNWINVTTDSDSNDQALTATYGAATVGSSALTVANSTLAAAESTVSVTVKDSFGVVTNKSGTKDLYLTIQGSSTTDLDETVAVAADGSASITFTNYLAEGESDLITAYLHTGATYAAANELDSEIISLYNPGDVAAVNVPASATGTITYSDFITGTASSTNIAPAEADKISVTGTVVDENGSGVPGAVVTIDADGMQLRKGGAGDYFQDTITFAANAAGGFTVDVWSHTVDITGVDITISSGGQSATTTIKTYLPAGLDGNNLVFSMEAPATPVVNQTYAIQASLTDKWGNPVATSGNAVRIQGVGSVTINSGTDAVDKSFRKDGTATVFLRSVKDIEGPGSVTATLLSGADYTTYANGAAVTDSDLGIAEILTDVATTVHDETSFVNEIELDVNVGGTPATSTDQKVNAGSFKGYVAVYARGYEGQRLSAKIGNDWVIVDPIVNNQENGTLHRTVDFTGAGVDIAVRIYIDRVLVDTINLTTK